MVAMAPSQALGPPAEPVKPSTDVNEYRRIRLDNEMEVLLVHDANTDKAAASVDVSLCLADSSSATHAWRIAKLSLRVDVRSMPRDHDVRHVLQATA